MILKSMAILVMSAGCLGIAMPHFAIAEETTGEKIQNEVGDVKTKTKRLSRKAARKTRNATGNGSVLKDAKDGAKDIGDKMTNEAEKVRRKAD